MATYEKFSSPIAKIYGIIFKDIILYIHSFVLRNVAFRFHYF